MTLIRSSDTSPPQALRLGMRPIPVFFVVGETTVDLMIPSRPEMRADELRTFDGYLLLPGGAALNTATALSFLGARVSHCGHLGRDFAGEFVVRWLSEHHIRPANTVLDPMCKTALSIISVEPGGELGIAQHTGGNGVLSLEDIAWPALSSAIIVHVAGAFTMNSFDGAPTAQILKRAKGDGKITGLSTTRNTARKAVLFPSLPYVDYLFLNRKEATEISGCSDEETAARHLQDFGAKNVAVTLGRHGVHVRTSSDATTIGSFPVCPVDTTGCGDSFVAGFLYATSLGMDARTAATWGNVVAAHCAKTLGAVTVPFTANEMAQTIFMHEKFGDVAALVLAGGKSQRMQNGKQKLLLDLRGKPLVTWVIDALREAGVHRIALLLGHDAIKVKACLTRSPVEFVDREETPRGTGYAVKVALNYLPALPDTVLVVNGDTPLLTSATLRRVVEHLHKSTAAVVACVSHSPDQLAYGHGAVRRDPEGAFQKIAHATSLDADSTAVEVNVGTYCFRKDALYEACQRLRPNGDGAIHLSDVLQTLSEAGREVALLHCPDFVEFISVNTHEHVAEVEAKLSHYKGFTTGSAK